jgi:hypothetical protein
MGQHRSPCNPRLQENQHNPHNIIRYEAYRPSYLIVRRVGRAVRSDGEERAFAAVAGR